MPSAAHLVIAGLGAVAAASTGTDVRTLIDSGRWNQARAAIEPLVKAHPGDAEAVAMQSEVRRAFADFEGAVAAAETAIRLDGKVAEYHWLLARACGEQARGAGGFKSLGLAKRFRQEAEEAIRLDPRHIQSRLYLISFYAGAPGIAGGDRKKAERIAEEVAAIDAGWGHVARARLLEEAATQSDPKTSERAALYRKAAESTKNPAARFEALTALTNLCLVPATQDLDTAIRAAREAAAIDPPRIDPYVGLAIAYASGGRWTDLDAALAEAEKAVPGNLAPFYQAGRVTFLQGKDDARAERYFRKYLTGVPEPGLVTLAHGHWRLGLTLERLGRKQDAISELQESVRLKPDFEKAVEDLRRLR